MDPYLRPGRGAGVSGGLVLCRVQDIPDGKARGFDWPRGETKVKILVARRGDRVFGYRNACPHVGVPLEMDADDFMSVDGRYLQCSTHGAMFQVEDGMCIVGPCAGRPLRAVPVSVVDGIVSVGD